MVTRQADVAKFLGDVTRLRKNEKIEFRLLSEGQVSTYFFKAPTKAVAFALGKRNWNVFFGVAPRKARSTRGRKDDITSVASLWIDLDRKGRTRLSTLKKRLDLFPLPPSYVISTGGGLHAYWRLEKRVEPERAEEALKALQEFFKSDHVTDCTRVLRLPGTLNHKYQPPREVDILESHPKRTYAARKLRILASVTHDVCRLLRGDAHTFKSRSERDFAVVAELCRRGGDYQLVRTLFSNLPIGDRYEESGDAYLERTFQSAVEFVGEVATNDDSEVQPEFIHFQDSYYVGDRRVSTFVLEPTGILEEAREDSLVCNVRSRGFVWERRVFPRSAFTRSDALQRHLPILSWQWLGTDKQVRSLLVQLVDQLLVGEGVPKIKATSVIGRHGDLWVTPSSVISANGVEPQSLVFVDVGRERPEVQCHIEEDDEVYRELLVNLLEALPKVNHPETLFPSLCWFLATLQKVPLEDAGIRFPILMLFGTRGSGKTSVVQDLFQRLIGYTRPRSFDCATTKFSMLALLGSTNAVPISFKEFRASTREGEHVQRMLRMAYDVGYDVRGRPDQTTTSYPLTAPITIDGEDLVTDPANLERMIAVNLRPETIMPGTVCYDAFYRTLSLPLEKFVGRYIQFCLGAADVMLHGWSNYVDRAQALARPIILPARIASNYAVLFYGLRVFQQFLNLYQLHMPVETPIFKESLSYVFDTLTGRTRLIIDDFVGDVINEVAIQGGNKFAWRLNNDTLWIHLKSTYAWWTVDRRRRGEEALGITALKQQLRERIGDEVGQYLGRPKTKKVGKQAFWMYPINTKAASKALDTPYPLSTTQFIISGASR